MFKIPIVMIMFRISSAELNIFLLYLQDFHLRFRGFYTHSTSFLKVLQEKKIELILCLIESIPTEGFYV